MRMTILNELMAKKNKEDEEDFLFNLNFISVHLNKLNLLSVR